MLSLLVKSNFLSVIIRIPVKILVVLVHYCFDFNPTKKWSDEAMDAPEQKVEPFFGFPGIFKR